MKAMINDLLDLARIETGSVDLRPEEATVASMVADVRGMIGAGAGARGVRLVPSGDLDAAVWADYQRAKQAVLTLVANAIKFSPDGGEVRVVARSEGARVRVTIEDDGPGLTPEEAAGLFREFSQTRAGRQAVEGAGLGLAISRKLAALMGGDLRVRSEPGRGAAFDLWLPAAGSAVTSGIPLAVAAGEA
jgi:signal transduction histidine kinase